MFAIMQPMEAPKFETKVNYNLKERDSDDTYGDDVSPLLCHSYVPQHMNIDSCILKYAKFVRYLRISAY